MGVGEGRKVCWAGGICGPFCEDQVVHEGKESSNGSMDAAVTCPGGYAVDCPGGGYGSAEASGAVRGEPVWGFNPSTARGERGCELLCGGCTGSGGMRGYGMGFFG